MRRRLAIAASIGLFALALRLDAASRLGMDHDEGVYLAAGQRYAEMIRAGDAGAILDEGENLEHPPLVKLAFGVGIAALGPSPPDHLSLAVCRGISALGGALGAALVAWVAPLGGLALALHTLHARYTAEAYLEAWPALLATAAILACARRRPRLAALALGAAAACKYPHAIAAAPIGIAWLLDLRAGRTRLREILAAAGLAAAAFLALDPWLWPDPPGRLAESLTFHMGYATGAAEGVAHPAWQPLVWLSRSWGAVWSPGVPSVALDGPIFALGLLGLGLGLRRGSRLDWLAAGWFAAGLALLLAWPTKWPHYVLVVLPALGLGFRFVNGQRVRVRERAAGSGWGSGRGIGLG